MRNLYAPPPSSFENPLGDDALAAKFRENAALGGFAASSAAEAQITATRGLEEAPEVGPLMRLLAEP